MLSCWFISHKTANLHTREAYALSSSQRDAVAAQLLSQTSVLGCMVLSTCNRTEFYLCLDPAYAGSDDLTADAGMDALILSTMARTLAAETTESGAINFQDSLRGLRTILWERQALAHLIRVAAGMDAQVLGDAQILGQVRQSWLDSRAQKHSCSELDQIMDLVLHSSKKIRNQTNIGEGVLSIASLATRKVQRIFSNQLQLKTLLLGAGKTALLTARHLHAQGIDTFFIAARQLSKAEQFAQQLPDATTIPVQLAEVEHYLPQCDILVGASASPQTLIQAHHIQTALQKRNYKPQLLLDLAVPRDIDPKVAQLPEAFLFDLDHLEEEADEGLIRRQQAIPQAERIISETIEAFVRKQNASQAEQRIKSYREQSLADMERVLAALLPRLQENNLTPDELRTEIRSLSRRLIHTPTVWLREYGTQNPMPPETDTNTDTTRKTDADA